MSGLKRLRWFVIIIIIGIWFSSTCMATNFLPNAKYQVCFVPEQVCGSMLVNLIDHAKKQILVQSYSFTSAPIARALVRAKQRGVDVKAILDKSQFKSQKNAVQKFLLKNNILVWMDYKVHFAHDKVMIVDNSIVAGGSFNYSFGAQFEDSENLIVIYDRNVAKQYEQHWEARRQASLRVREDLEF